MSKRKRSPHQPLWHMPNLDTEGAIGFYSTKLGTDRQTAAVVVKRHQDLYYGDPNSGRAPIVWDDVLKMWHGRKVHAIRERAGMRRTGDNPNSYRNRLRDILGNLSYFRSDLLAAIKTGLNVTDHQAEQIFVQGRQGKGRGFLLCDNDRPEATGTWRFHSAPLPDPTMYQAEKADSRRAHYLRIYQDMPRLKHRPGDFYDPAESEVIKFILEKNGSTDFAWGEKEYNRVRKCGTSSQDKNAVFIYDSSTCETLGVRTWRSEAKHQPEKRNCDADFELFDELIGANMALLKEMPVLNKKGTIRYLKACLKGEYDLEAFLEYLDNSLEEILAIIVPDRFEDETSEGYDGNKDFCYCGWDNYGGEDSNGNSRAKGSKWLPELKLNESKNELITAESAKAAKIEADKATPEEEKPWRGLHVTFTAEMLAQFEANDWSAPDGWTEEPLENTAPCFQEDHSWENDRS
jgi:hypothetical protein